MFFKNISYHDLEKLKIDLGFSSTDHESLKIYNIYRHFFTEYFIKKLDLLFFDKKCLDMGIYSKMSNFYSNYTNDYLKCIFIRNDIFINNITEEEKRFLLENENRELNDEIADFIEKTYDRVINRYDDKTYCFYDYQIRKYCVKSDNVVIGIYNSNYDLDHEVNQIAKDIESRHKKIHVLVYSKNIEDIKNNDFNF